VFVDQEGLLNSLGYHPEADQVESFARMGRFTRAVVVGVDVPDMMDHVDGMRRVVDSTSDLPAGFYWFGGQQGPQLLIVLEGARPGAPSHLVINDATEDHPLVGAFEWMESLWEEGEDVARPVFPVNEEVLTRSLGESAIVKRRSCINGRWTYEVSIGGRRKQVAEGDLRPLPILDDPEQWVDSPPDSAESFSATLTRAKLEGGFTDTVFSFRATRTLFRPYQFRPVMKLLTSGKMRLLIADEVGLGKTIEAGLVWTELDARQLAHRVLILTPSSLVAKWKHEMEERFGYELIELDSQGLANITTRLEQDRLPRRAHYICSIERLRAWQDLEVVSDLRLTFDLTIVDEAHAFRNKGTKNNALGSLISEWSRALVFLSATPLNLGNADLYNLLELLTPGEFGSIDVLEEMLEPNQYLGQIATSLTTPNSDPRQSLAMLDMITSTTFGSALRELPEFKSLHRILEQPVLTSRAAAQARRAISSLHSLSAVVTRTRKVEIQEQKPVREAISVPVDWTQTEAAFYREFYEWCVARANAVNMPVGFAMQMPLRVASTCTPVARDLVLNWSSPWVLADEDDLESMLEPSPSASIPPSTRLVELAEKIGGIDTKFDSFLPKVREIIGGGRQVLVFTFSLPTIAYLRRKLGDEFRVAVLNGSVKPTDRHRIIADFRAGKYDLVVANRVASEGLDFEFCSAVVNYDLPWNPMEVEQRIGRIDRIGQMEEKIYVVNFHTPGTIEANIIERVMERIGVFKQSIGELEPIVQNQLRQLQDVTYDFSLSEAEREQRLAEIQTAIEDRALTREELEKATPSLLSSDGVDIEGLEADLLSSGRYVGQEELRLLVTHWVRAGGGSVELMRNQESIVVTGNASLASEMRALSSDGVRSPREIETIVSSLMNESPLVLSLDQEQSRQKMTSLLTANHPMVRAALKTKQHEQARFAHLALPTPVDGIPSGTYFTLLAKAEWKGIRPNREIWAATTDLDGTPMEADGLGAGLLAAIATASLSDMRTGEAMELATAVRSSTRTLRSRLNDEGAIRKAENDALIETRRLSMQRVHERQMVQIAARMDSVRQSTRDDSILRMFVGQQRRERERFDAEIRQIATAHDECGMNLSWLAACVVEVP
jgi:superfamily II DNA or RNA helicase